MHLGDELIHACELIGSGLDDEIDTFADHIEVGVGDKDRDLNEDIFFQGEARHFTVNPDQMREFGSHIAQFRGLAGPSVNSA